MRPSAPVANCRRLASRRLKPALVTTTKDHSLYAGGPAFDAKAMDELSYVPRRLLQRLSPYDFAFSVNPLSMHRDARDPLNP